MPWMSPSDHFNKARQHFAKSETLSNKTVSPYAKQYNYQLGNLEKGLGFVKMALFQLKKNGDVLAAQRNYDQAETCLRKAVVRNADHKYSKDEMNKFAQSDYAKKAIFEQNQKNLRIQNDVSKKTEGRKK